MTTEDQKNSHLIQYLDYYIKLENPGYAVMVTGDWGVGKTYQVKKYFGLKKENKIQSTPETNIIKKTISMIWRSIKFILNLLWKSLKKITRSC